MVLHHTQINGNGMKKKVQYEEEKKEANMDIEHNVVVVLGMYRCSFL